MPQSLLWLTRCNMRVVEAGGRRVSSHDEWAIVPLDGGVDHSRMKRIAAAPLWFLVGWVMGSAVGWGFGLNELLAPIAAFALAGIVVGDPRGFIWNDGPREKALTRLIATADAPTS